MAMTATVTGPVTGGAHGWPFGSPGAELGVFGYREDEFFLQGIASAYRPRAGTGLTFDGRWDVEPASTSPYTTRIVVYRPIDAQLFNGTVLVSWNNATTGFDQYSAASPEILGSGYVYVAVTTQRACVHGREPMPMGLHTWDPERYGTLSIASDDFSFDVYTQAARAVGRDRSVATVDPLDGLDVRHVVGVGGSQSGGWLATYINAIQPIAGVFDAFLPTIYFGAAAALDVGESLFLTLVDGALLGWGGMGAGSQPIPTMIRDDVDALVMIVNSETEASPCYGVRQPDTDRFRYWEVAGTAHISAQMMRSRMASMARDVGAAMEVDVTGVNEVPLEPVVDAAYRSMRVWLTEGTPPPIQPRIEFAGEPAEIVRDEHGIARGGIRLPQIEVPLATNSAVPGDNPNGGLGGSCVPFPPEKIRALYENVDTYLARFEQATRVAEQAGVLLPRDVEPLLVEAKETFQRQTGDTPELH
jgi:hypothetical protein